MAETSGESSFQFSKIKRIAIELKDYYFFHSPFQIKNQDRRFIGREKKRLQLLSVLKDTNSNSGTYLITGYRGSGKTSFVNMVLTNIEHSLRLQCRKIFFLRIWLFFTLLVPLFFYLPHFDILKVSIPAFVILLWLIDPLKKRTDSDFVIINPVPFNKKVYRFLRAVFYISPNSNIDYEVLNLIRSLFITTLLIGITFFLIPIIGTPPSNRLSLWLIHLISGAFFIFIYWIILILIDLLMALKRNSRNFDNPPNRVNFNHFRILNRIIHYGQSILRWGMEELKKQLKPKLVIRLNMNYGNLTERNVLQLIASSLYDRYRRWRRTPFQILLKIIYLVSFWLLIALSYQTLILEPKSKLGTLNHEIRIRIIKPGDMGNRSDADELNVFQIFNEHVNYVYQGIRSTIADVCYYFFEFFGFIGGFIRFFIPGLDGNVFIKIAQYLYPAQFDYLLTLSFLTLYFLTRWLCYHQIFYIPGHARIFYLLRTLEERMSAGVMVQSGAEASGSGGFFKIFRQKHLSYPLADERTIELSIINVLKEISRIPIFLGHPIFIFVFDELDKMTTTEIPPKPEEEILYMSSFETLRRRQREVEKILSNLKQLLTTAHAKFIFIAGREMYDAGLADFTGRAFLHSSIFNQTFYIDSFLTDSSVSGDENIYGMVESYVCQFLLPYYDPEWSFNWPKLKDYEQYLDKKYILKSTEMEKVIQLLLDFIVFLTYRGNGSPKKITQLFESYIQPLPEKRKQDEWFIIGENKKSRYLVFTFPQQFITGNTARLIGPLAHTIERTVSQSNDKLATSIFMVLDYLFKFHRTAFRRDFLEWMPEMLDIHSDPDLRHTVQEMLELIDGIYLERVYNGLFDYRFTNRIKGEIDYACRIDERKSAAFNFTLDESLEAEQFIRRQLKDQLRLYEIGKAEIKEKPLAISRLHEIIGDLHNFDGEYDLAITEYYNALTRLGK
ncbi:ATP-binding protein [candidate division KSB1 bacterium]|nr:ATP-binding protein [candidate division KSB1 bacterium]